MSHRIERRLSDAELRRRVESGEISDAEAHQLEYHSTDSEIEYDKRSEYHDAFASYLFEAGED